MINLIDRDSVKCVALLGVPVEVGASQPGTLMGPAALRTAGLGLLLENLGFKVEDHGDISVHGHERADDNVPQNAKYYREIQTWTQASRPNPGERSKDVARGVYASHGVDAMLPKPHVRVHPRLALAGHGVSSMQRCAQSQPAALTLAAHDARP